MTTSSQASNKLSELRNLRIDRTPTPTKKRWTKRLIVIGVSVVVLVAIAIVAASRLVRSVPEVQTVQAKPVDSAGTAGTLSATGYIIAHHKIDVNSKVTGRVKWIGVEKGDHVQAGQVLVELEDEEFKAQVEQARGQVESARAYLRELQAGSRPQEIEQAGDNLEEARATMRDDKITFDRTLQLNQAGVLARQQLDDAQARYEADVQKVASLSQTYTLTKIGPRQEEIARAHGNLIQAEGQLAYAESQLAAAKIRAPVTGTILERTAEKGELVTSTFASAAAGGPLGSAVSVADLTDLQVELDIAQDEFARLHLHQRGAVTTDAYPDRKYDGVLTEVAPEANRQKATVQVKVQVQNADGYLRPDMNATVQFIPDAPASTEPTRGVLIPAKAIHSNGRRQYVLVAYEGRAIARDIRVITQRSDGTVVDGLTGGEDLILGAPPTVKDGSRIKRKP